MDTAEAGRNRTSPALWLSLALFLLVFAVGGWLLLRREPPPPKKSLASVSFPGGGFDLLRAENTAVLSFEGRKQGFLPKLFSNRSGSGTGFNGMNLTVHPLNNRLEMANCYIGAPGLMLLCRATKVGRSPFPRVIPFREDGRGGSRGFVLKELTTPVGGGVDLGSSLAKAADLTLEVEDGAGGWLTMSGPIVLDLEGGRSVAYAHVYPRRNPRLKLRISPLGETPLVVEIDNPGYVAAPPAWTPQALPARFDDKWLSITWDGQELWPYPTKLRVGKGSELPRVAYEFRDMLYSDPTGNIAPIGDFTLLPGESLIKLSGAVTKTEMYPRPFTETDVFAEGVWPPPGNLVKFTANKFGQSMGITSIDAKAAAPETDYETKLPQQLELTIKGGGKRSGTPTSRNPFEPGRTTALIYIEDGTMPSGRLRRHGSGSHASGSTFTYDAQFTWSAEAPSPGQVLRLAMPRDRSPVGFEFIIDAGKLKK